MRIDGWFSARGWEPFEFQRQVWSAYLDGESGLIHSATGTGKTLAAWMGAVADDGPFYYRVHSPVVLIEFDHHPGVAFDNVVPSRNHIHTVVRTPNGGDYGLDLLRQHHERFDHSTGIHIARP